MGDSKRFPGPPARVLIGPSVRGPSLITGNRPSFASALTDCWNNGSTTASSSSRRSTSTSSHHNVLKTTCLFCPNFVILSGPRSEPADAILKRAKRLKTLCYHLQLNGEELPRNGTKTQFPFCTTCEKQVNELHELQETLEKVKAKIAKTVSTIERIVADREILGTAPPTPIERQKFFKLYKMILEGYRKKLMLRRQINNSMTLGTSPDPLNPQKKQKLHQFIRELSPPPTQNRGDYHSLSGFGRIEDDDDNMEVLVDPLDVGAEIEVENDEDDSSSPDLQHQSYEDYNFNEEESYETGWSGAGATYNESNCTLVISNVQSAAASGSGGSAPAEPEVIDLVDIKQEVMAAAEEKEEEEDGDGTSANVYALAPCKRRLLFEGVEIFKCNGTGARKNDEFLQCSDCDFTLPILKLTRRGAKEDMSPYMKLKQHILNVHKNQPGAVKPRAPPKFTCGECNIEFPNLQTLREHNKTHPPSDHLICDVCQRPIKGSHFNLLLHKFSHKNDSERLEALRNKERGSYNAFLSAKLTSVYMGKKKTTNAPDAALPDQRSNNKKKRTRTRRGASAAVQAASTPVTPEIKAPVAVASTLNQSAANLASTTTSCTTAIRSARAARRRENSDPDEGIAKPYGCRICYKYFSQKNHLTSHMRSHGFRRSERGMAQEEEEKAEGKPIPSTSAAALASSPSNQSSEAGISSRKRRALDSPAEATTTSTSVDVEPPLLSPVETAALAESLENTINEVCTEMGISPNAVENGGNEGEEEIDAPELKREVN